LCQSADDIIQREPCLTAWSRAIFYLPDQGPEKQIDYNNRYDFLSLTTTILSLTTT
jgi:hypothetical protein